jgi:hypothetical protein
MPFDPNDTVNFGQAYLAESGYVVQESDGAWIIRRFDPNEQMDSKWDVLMNGGGWGAAALLCFADHRAMTFGTVGAAIEYAEMSLPNLAPS